MMWSHLLLATAIAAPDDAPVPNFVDDIAPLLRENCVSCHRGSRARNGLDLRSVKSILKGGSAGPAVVPGDSSGSLLYQVMAHEAEPFMPPDEEALDQVTVQLVAAWIDGGARVDANDTGSSLPAAAAPVVAPPLPSGKAPMPAELPTQPAWWTERGGAVMAVAVSPGAPLAAVAGYRQVSLYGLPGGELLGVLPFPAGQVHSLRFSAGGEALVAGGGRSADSGKAVAWDVATGRAWSEVGDEPDVVLDADISVDLGLIALGGPDRVLRVFDTATGELSYEGGGHTDWVTAVAFSPDGVLVASGDRAGGLFVREALTGEEFHRLPAVDGGVTSLSWRADSMSLAASGEGGKVALFEMENGKRTKNFGAGSGVLDLQYGRAGGIVSAGRDGRFRLHDGGGKERVKLGPAPGPAVCAAVSGDGQWILGGDSAGGVHIIEVASKVTRAVVTAFPPTDEARRLQLAVERAEGGSLAEARARLEVTGKEASAVGLEKESAAKQRASAASAARSQEAAAGLAAANASLQAAEDAASGFEPVLVEWSASLVAAEAAEARALAAEAAAERVLMDRVAALDLALLRRAEARGGSVTAAEEAEAAAAERTQGATATLQLAAGEAARASVLVERLRAQVVRWRGRAEPRLAALAAAGAEQARAAERAKAQAAEGASEAAQAALAQSAAKAAQVALAAAREALEAAEVDSAALDAELEAAREADGARRADLVRSGGEVRAIGEG